MSDFKCLDASASTFSSRNEVTKIKKKVKQRAAVKAFTHDEFMAAAIGDTAWLKQSLRGGKDASRFDRNGLAAIHLAALHGRLECIKFLVETCKVDVNLASSTGWRALHLAINSRTGKRGIQCLKYLLDKGANPSVYNDDMLTPSHQAAIEGSAKCLEALIEAGADINLPDSKGHIPLDYTKIWGHRICARMLASQGWRKDKEIQAQQMKEADFLSKLKEEEIQLQEEAREAEKKFFGNISFSNWLGSKGLTPKPTGPETNCEGLHMERSHSRSQNSRTLPKANSKQQVNLPQMELNRMIPSAIKANQPTAGKHSSKSGRIKEEVQQHQPAIKVTSSATKRIESDDFSELPQYMIDRLWLERMSKHDRPLTFKCKNIIDAQHKKLYDESQKPVTETYAHLSDCIDSELFPQPTLVSQSSENGHHWSDNDIDRMTNAFRSWSNPDRFPAIKGNEYKYAFEALKQN